MNDTDILKEAQNPIIFLDMDGVLADFEKAPAFCGRDFMSNPPEMYEESFFETLPVVDGALRAVRYLINHEKFDVHVLSQPVRFTHFSHSEKSTWLWKWFPELGERLHLTQNKALLAAPGRILIDDMLKWRDPWEKLGGTFIHFNPHLPSRGVWSEILQTVMSEMSFPGMHL